MVKCTACGYTTIIGSAFEFEYVATEEGHCEHKFGTTCDWICTKTPRENLMKKKDGLYYKLFMTQAKNYSN